MDKQLNFDEFDVPSFQEWQRRIEKDLKGKSIDSLKNEPAPGVEVLPVAQNHNAHYDYLPQLEFRFGLALEADFYHNNRHQINEYQPEELLLLSPQGTAPSLGNYAHLLNLGHGPISELALIAGGLLEQQEEVVLLSLGENFFTEIAKLIALRALLTECGLELPKICTVSGLRNKTTRAVHVNLLRNSTEAMAAYLGGSDTHYTLPHLAASGEQDQGQWLKACRLAINVGHLLREESRFTLNRAPLEGSPIVDQLARRLTEKAYRRLAQWQEAEDKPKLKNEWLENDRAWYRTASQQGRGLVGSGSFVHPDDAEKAPIDLPAWLRPLCGDGQVFRFETLSNG